MRSENINLLVGKWMYLSIFAGKWVVITIIAPYMEVISRELWNGWWFLCLHSTLGYIVAQYGIVIKFVAEDYPVDCLIRALSSPSKSSNIWSAPPTTAILDGCSDKSKRISLMWLSRYMPCSLAKKA